MKEKLVFVGNGMAGMRTLEELLKLADDPAYNRLRGEVLRFLYERQDRAA